MTLAWVLASAASAGTATILAAADGALLASTDTARDLTGDPERTHRALVLGRVLLHLVTGAALAHALWHSPLLPVWALVAAVLLLLVNVVGVEGTARARGYARGDPLLGRLAPIVVAADLVMRPVTWLGGGIERGLGRILPPADEDTLRRNRDAEHFHAVVAAEAHVSPAEEDILLGVFALRETEVREIMLPRVDVVGVERATPWSQVVDRVRSSGHARLPVFVDTLDNVIGILYAKDLLAPVAAGAEPDDWTSLIRPAVFIPGTKTIDQQLRDFKSQRTHIAIVSDEYGGTAGLVTIEDVLEEIVGEIRDEDDEEDAPVEQDGAGRFWVAGRVTLADLSELLGADLQRDDLTTVGGLVYDLFGHIPRAGDGTTIGAFKVVVERVRHRRIERVYFERLATATERVG